MSTAALMAKAREVADVDIMDDAVVEPLEILHHSLSTEASLHEEGALAKQAQLVRLLANRLRMQRDFAAHPEIADQPINGPVVINGMPRSGTTKTQNVLAASGDFNWLTLWQTYNPASFTGKPNESTAARIHEADEYCRWMDARSPEAKLAHPFEALDPEEDSWLLEQCFVSGVFAGYARVPSYLKWLSRQNPVQTFEFLRDAFKYLQWQGLADPEKPWLMKCPLYIGSEPQLLAVFPNAKIVQTHRSPLRTIPSACKLASLLHKPFADVIADIPFFSEGFAAALNQNLKNRKNGLPAIDVSFHDIFRSLDNVVEKIYAHIGLELRPESRERMRRWEADNPPHKGGKFQYSLEEFGLEEARIRHLTADYFDFVEALFGEMPA
jgi:hypothetical protein